MVCLNNRREKVFTLGLHLAPSCLIFERAGSRIFAVQYHREIAVTQIEQPIYFASAPRNS
jgi:hypothetical protein